MTEKSQNNAPEAEAEEQAILTGLAAQLSAAEPDAGLSVMQLAAYLDGGLKGAERERVIAQLAASPAELCNAIAALEYLENLPSEAPPQDLVAALLARSAKGNVVPFARRAAPAEIFLPLAAASEGGGNALLCRSQSGLWTLQVFVGRSAEDQQAQRGYLILKVNPEHRQSYEGLIARVFVKSGASERVLSESPIRDGELYAPVSLAGLDLQTKDAVNIVFGDPPDGPES